MILSDGKIGKELGSLLSESVGLLDELDTERGNSIIKIINTCKDIGIKFAFENKELNKYFIVIDDLERISDEIDVTELLGQFYTEFIEKNIKVLFVSDESRIKNIIKYKEQKEKFIRITIDFQCNYKEIFKNLLRERNLENDNRLIEIFADILEQRKEENTLNLRTIIFSLDIYLKLYQSYEKIDDKELYPLNELFYSIIIFCLEYKSANIPSEEYDKLSRNYFTSRMLYNIMAKRNGQEKEWDELFHEKFNTVKYNFNLPLFVIDFIIKGYLDGCQFNDYFEIKSLSEKDQLINELTYYEDLETNELVTNISRLLVLLKDKKLDYFDLVNIHQKLTYFIENEYINIDLDEYEKYMLQIIDSQKTKIKNSIEGLSVNFELQDNDTSNIIHKKIYTIKREFTQNNKKEEFEKLITSLLTDSTAEFKFLYTKLNPSSFFEKLIYYKQLARFTNIKNTSLTLLSLIVKDKILSISNAGQAFYNEKEYLVKLQIFFNTEKEQYIKDKLKLKKIDDLLVKLEAAIKHLDLTKNKI